MPDSLVIRRESPDQPEVVALLDALDRYLATLYPPEANYILGVQELLAPEVSFFVARDHGRIVGTGAARRMPPEAATGGVGYGEIKRMYVDTAQRGRRLGVQILQTIEQDLRDSGQSLALLETGSDQTEAVRLYERASYTRRGPFGGYPDNGLSVFYGKWL